MSAIKWDEAGTRLYETGVKNGVLYRKDPDTGKYTEATPWNGLTSISENPSGAEPSPLYADDIKYITLMSKEEIGGTIEAYTYPDEFAECDGTASLAAGITIGQQKRETFGLCYTTTVGNDEKGTEYGSKIHILYNCLASPSQKSYTSMNESPEAITFSWEFTTTPVEVTGHAPTALVVIDTAKVAAEKLTLLKKALFGSDGTGSGTGTDPYLPTPDEIVDLIK